MNDTLPLGRFTRFSIPPALHHLPRLLVAGLLLSVGCGTVRADCTPRPDGLVGWWRGEANYLDSSGGANGTPVGEVTFGPGRVGSAFVLDGNRDGVLVGNPASLQIQNLTLEMWIRRSSTSAVSHTAPNALLFGYDVGGYSLGLFSDGRLIFGKSYVDGIQAPVTITDTNFHHVAVTKAGSTVFFYVDGTAYAMPAYSSTFTFSTQAAIGFLSADWNCSFLGVIDEVSVYNRALVAAEIQAIHAAGSAGKCVPPSQPVILTQPASRTVMAGEGVSFSVTVSGSAPLSYQWLFEGQPLTGGTTPTLILTAQMNNAGSYSVQVGNAYGSALSSNAVLTVTAPPPCAPEAAGLVSWWRLEGNALEFSGQNAGTLVGQAAWTPSRVGQGVALDGNADGILVGNPANLQLQDLTIEAWIKRSSTTAVSQTAPNALIFGYDVGGYSLGLWNDGRLFFGKSYVDSIQPPTSITDTGFHHVAVTKAGNTVVFYVDGTAFPMPAYGSAFTFSTQAAIGCFSAGGVCSFFGVIDEVSVYNQALTATEIQAIHAASSGGKCTTPTPPVILTHPADRTVMAGEGVSLSVSAGGTRPLSYQWLLEGQALAGGTTPTFTFIAQSTNAGSYSVLVSNALGFVLSSNAVLTVTPPPPCAPVPAGLVSWWRLEGDALDHTGLNTGTLEGQAAWVPGRAGLGVALDGNRDGIRLGNSASLRLQDLTIEGWIQRASSTAVSFSTAGNATLFGWGAGGYMFWMDSSGGLRFNLVGETFTPTGPTISDTARHHVAVTKAGTAVVFYLDGVPFAVPSYGSVFSFGSSVAIGCRPESLDSSFYGTIDEVSVYNRALTPAELQSVHTAGVSGKCVIPLAPYLLSQPASQSVVRGESPTLSVTAAGTAPLFYEWSWNGAPLAGATASSLTLTNVQFNQAGSYGVTVTNPAGSVTSSNAVVTVTFPPAPVRVVAAGVMAGGPVTVPVEIVANGNENALQFSLSFNPALLTYSDVELGASFADATLFVNASQVASGRLGIILALPTEATLAPGAHQVVRVTFNTGTRITGADTPVSFGDVPIVRQLVDAQARTLTATYSQANVTLSPTIWEADVSPRPNGDSAVTVADWVLLGRYAARLEYPTNASEFQRADCAPRTTSGDGSIKVTDWVQTGRYAAGADSLTIVGGPTEDSGESALFGAGPKDDSDRLVLVGSNAWFAGESGQVSVVLVSQGNESALGFSLTFDAARFAYLGAVRGTSSSSATLHLNTTQAASGRVGVALALSSGVFPAGSREMVKVTLRALPDAVAGASRVEFADAPVPREISDPGAMPLASTYTGGTITVRPLPALGIVSHDGDVMLTWPSWATSFNLQANSRPVASGWTNAAVTPVIVGENYQAIVPAQDGTLFYRLVRP
jgi:hypothetical protein